VADRVWPVRDENLIPASHFTKCNCINAVSVQIALQQVDFPTCDLHTERQLNRSRHSPPR
jgi:hypothetical protein